MNAYLLVALGGAAGSVIRYACQKVMNQSFPYGTLFVNLAGCFLIGILWALIVRKQGDNNLTLLLMTGLCGGFTTFSALTYEGMQMMFTGKWMMVVTYILCSVAGGLVATAAGYKLFS